MWFALPLVYFVVFATTFGCVNSHIFKIRMGLMNVYKMLFIPREREALDLRI